MLQSLKQLSVWVADRVQERSTWQGVAIIASVFGINLHADAIFTVIDQFSQILLGAGVICGANSIFKTEPTK